MNFFVNLTVGIGMFKEEKFPHSPVFWGIGILLIMAIGYDLHLGEQVEELEGALLVEDSKLAETLELSGEKDAELHKAQEEIDRLTRQKAELIKEVKFFDYARHTVDLMRIRTFLQPDHPDIKALAEEKDPQGLYEFVRDEIGYSSRAESNHNAGEILKHGDGNCVEKAVLLASLLRAKGYPPEEVQVVLGTINYIGYEWEPPENHAWVEFFYEGRWLVLDPTSYLGDFEFGQWEKEEFYSTYNVEDYFRYNDMGSSIVKKYDTMPDPSLYR
jgi:transglutaminase-like putative cysteine protease